jgi:hypothetical protein
MSSYFGGKYRDGTHILSGRIGGPGGMRMSKREIVIDS